MFDPFEGMKPTFNKHDYKAWRGYPKQSKNKNKPDYTQCENVVHLNDNIRIRTWTAIHAYFWALDSGMQ